MRLCRFDERCAECADNHWSDHCTKGPGSARKCALCKGTHRAGAHTCEAERKERQRIEYIRTYTPELFQCTMPSFPTAKPIITTDLPAPSQTQSQPITMVDAWQVVSKGRRGRPSFLSQAAKDRGQLRIAMNQLGKRKERDFTSPSPPERTTRSQSQPASESRNSIASWDFEEEL